MYASFYKILSLAKDIDIYNINYMYRKESLKIRIMKIHKKQYNIIIGITAYFFNTIRFNISGAFRLNKNYKEKKKTVLFFMGTNNQRSALEPIINSNYYTSSMITDNLDDHFDIPINIIYLYSIIFIPFVVRNYYFTDTFKKWTYRFIFPQYILVYGYYVYLYKLLIFLEPKAVIMSNDHNMINRVILLVSKQLGLKTIYVQHASISKIMPPMEFDYALLEGRDALKKYSDLGIKGTKVFLVGNIKYSPYKRLINRNTQICAIGICITPTDNLEDIDALCSDLNKLSAFQFTIRPHPALEIGYIQKMAAKFGFEYSDPDREISFEFLKRVDSIIVSSSNILLEAALMNVTPIVFQPDVPKLINPYSSFMEFLKLKGFTDIKDLISYINSIKKDKPNFRDNTKYFCETIGTKYDGKSSIIAKKIIHNIINNDYHFYYMKKSKFEDYEYFSTN